jgi:hypothetical protein
MTEMQAEQVRDRAAEMRQRMSAVDWAGVLVWVVSAVPWLLGFVVAAVLTVATLLLSAFLTGFSTVWDRVTPAVEDEEEPEPETIFHGGPTEAEMTPPAIYRVPE